MLLSDTYVTFYFIYAIFGYNCAHKYTRNKSIDMANLIPKSQSFIGKRICMLSLIALLYSAYFLNNPSINTFLNLLLIHSVVIIGYYVKWKIDEPITFYMHVFWIFPVTIYTDYSKITYGREIYYNLNLSDNGYMIMFLCYYYLIQGYIYTKRIPGIDNPA